MQVYCPCCRVQVEAVEQLFDGGQQLICDSCGTIVEDSPIQDPNSLGNGDVQNEGQTEHWFQSLCGSRNSSSLNWSVHQAILKEDSAAGLKYRQDTSTKKSPLFSTISASIISVCLKLGLDRSLKKEVESRWNELRDIWIAGGVRFSRSRAPALGIACVFWVCRKEGMEVSLERLAMFSGVSKSSILGATLIVEKAFGSPGPPIGGESYAPTDVEKHDRISQSGGPERNLKDALNFLRHKIDGDFYEDTELLAQTLFRLGRMPDAIAQTLVVLCGHLLVNKYRSTRFKWPLRHFCKTYRIDYCSNLERMSTVFREVIQQLTTGMIHGTPAQELRYWMQHLKDFVVLLEGIPQEDLPESLFSFSR